jgi:hypothetical protein
MCGRDGCVLPSAQRPRAAAKLWRADAKVKWEAGTGVMRRGGVAGNVCCTRSPGTGEFGDRGLVGRGALGQTLDQDPSWQCFLYVCCMSKGQGTLQLVCAALKQRGPDCDGCGKPASWPARACRVNHCTVAQLTARACRVSAQAAQAPCRHFSRACKQSLLLYVVVSPPMHVVIPLLLAIEVVSRLPAALPELCSIASVCNNLEGRREAGEPSPCSHSCSNPTAWPPVGTSGARTQRPPRWRLSLPPTACPAHPTWKPCSASHFWTA